MNTLPPNPQGDANEGVTPAVPGAEPARPAPPAPPAPPAAPAAAGAQQPPSTPPPAAPQAPQAAQGADPLSNIQVNYWLSVFFTWLPALIFYLIEKDKGQTLANKYHVANLNFSLVRTIVIVALFITSAIPYIGFLIGTVLWLASIVLFVFHIIAASKASADYRAGKNPEFIFNLQMVK